MSIYRDPYPEGWPHFSDADLQACADRLRLAATWIDNTSEAIVSATGCYTDEERVDEIMHAVECMSYAFSIMASNKINLGVGHRMNEKQQERFEWFIRKALDAGQAVDEQQ